MTKLKTFLLVSLSLTAAACSPMTATRGNIVEDYRLAEVTPGVSTQSDVLRVMGSPTTQDPFDPNVWYYLGQRTEKKGIFDPKVVEEKVVRVTFNKETGTVAEVTPLDNIRNDIPISGRVTPTSGNEMTAVQQMLGNLGKFNKDKRASAADLGN